MPAGIGLVIMISCQTANNYLQKQKLGKTKDEVIKNFTPLVFSIHVKSKSLSSLPTGISFLKCFIIGFLKKAP